MPASISRFSSSASDFDRGLRHDGEPYIRVLCAKRRGDRRHHRQRSRDHGDAQPAGKAMLEGVDFLPHCACVTDDAARPFEYAFALGGKILEARAAIDQQHAHLLLDLLDARRQRRLGHAAGLGGPAEMLFAGQRQQKFELVDHAIASCTLSIVPARRGRPVVSDGTPPHLGRSHRLIDNNIQTGHF